VEEKEEDKEDKGEKKRRTRSKRGEGSKNFQFATRERKRCEGNGVKVKVVEEVEVGWDVNQ